MSEIKVQSEPLSVSVNETKRLTGLSHTGFYRALKAGHFETFMNGRKRLVRYPSIKRFVAGEVS
jgi:hypothetical protein